MVARCRGFTHKHQRVTYREMRRANFRDVLRAFCHHQHSLAQLARDAEFMTRAMHPSETSVRFERESVVAQLTGQVPRAGVGALYLRQPALPNPQAVSL